MTSPLPAEMRKTPGQTTKTTNGVAMRSDPLVRLVLLSGSHTYAPAPSATRDRVMPAATHVQHQDHQQEQHPTHRVDQCAWQRSKIVREGCRICG
jgi:hypothetical protein